MELSKLLTTAGLAIVISAGAAEAGYMKDGGNTKIRNNAQYDVDVNADVRADMDARHKARSNMRSYERNKASTGSLEAFNQRFAKEIDVDVDVDKKRKHRRSR